jgi:hypothetical protein
MTKKECEHWDRLIAESRFSFAVGTPIIDRNGKLVKWEKKATKKAKG